MDAHIAKARIKAHLAQIRAELEKGRMQNRIHRIDENSCIARPDHTSGQSRRLSLRPALLLCLQLRTYCGIERMCAATIKMRGQRQSG